MLTSALNKSPKPPIIVDDIIVTELNLGSVPPELEILEIGDLAEDKFRGIFKMSYTGDAFLTLKTRVQANPLNTYLSTKPSFASPQPLAASSGLTIPLQITLSDIRLSGFVILVFSKQKGITLVFRNDPLESLKVSSTFDSIPFVRDYLQKEIEGQLRVLFMEDLPAIIHRLSLRVWSPDHHHRSEDMAPSPLGEKDLDPPIDPLASPSQNAFDAFGRPLDDSDLSPLSLDHQSQTHATFSQKNLLRLAALTDSHRTLALFTPSIRDAVFRAWAGAAERGDVLGVTPPVLGLGALSRRHSVESSVSGSVYSFSDNGAAASTSSRPTLSSATSVYSFNAGAGRSRPHASRRRKHRVVNLRKPKPEEAEADGEGSRPTTPTSTTTSSREATVSEEREGELITPPDSPDKKTPRARLADPANDHVPPEILSPRPRTASSRLHRVMDEPEEEMREHVHHPHLSSQPDFGREASNPPPLLPSHRRLPGRPKHLRDLQRTQSFPLERRSSTSPNPPAQTGSILEQAWMMKMANEIARRVEQEKSDAAAAAAAAAGDGHPTHHHHQHHHNQHSGQGRSGLSLSHKPGFWETTGSGDAEEVTPPPAYAA